jgi:DNA-binding NarL/FixJ family response regulator
MQKFLVIDDHPLLRTGLALTLQSLDAQAVIYEASDIKEALSVLKNHPDLDLVITDLHLPVIDGIAGLSVMRQQHPQLRIVLISAQYTAIDVELAMQRGAAGFIPKSYSSQQISQVLQLILDGGTYHLLEQTSQDTALQFHHPLRSAITDHKSATPTLTDRQMQVLALLVQGKSNKVICDELDLAAGTVKIHISSLLRALRVTNRTQAVLAAAKLGLKL